MIENVQHFLPSLSRSSHVLLILNWNEKIMQLENAIN
jgi:hypothetical protein